jgi:hypothetical protein
MSYLDPPRLHFAGKFAATISTVNNDPAHFNNATFKPEYQERQTRSALNGWFNPRGDGDWRLTGCKVTGAVMQDGSPVIADPILTCIVADSDRLPPAKIVDLDSEQQLVSTIWGLEMRICDATGENMLRAPFVPAAFMDIWTRSIGSDGGGDNSAAAMYQSVLFDLEWGPRASSSPFLKELMTAAVDGRLSVKFNVDGINLNWKDPDFMRGRITGTIGAAQAKEPTHFVRGRQFMATSSGAQGFPVPAGGLNNCVASLDPQAGVLHLDLGNALPTSAAGGPIADLGTLSVVYIDPQAGPRPIGDIAYTAAGWYESTAGVVSLLVPRYAVGTVASSQLAIRKPEVDGQAIAIAEPATGLHCRADEFVYRLDAGQTTTATVWASVWGQPYPNARITVIHDPNQLQPAPFGGVAVPGAPEAAIEFPDTIVANEDGIASLPIGSREPGNPRGFIDGQVYGVRPMLEETTAPGAGYPFNVWEFISVLVFDAFNPDEPPTWRGSLQPIFQQYANLYPLMADIVNLEDYDSVCEMREMLMLAFEEPISSPNSMPATRDLSNAKRTAILTWLGNLGPDGKPLLGALPPPAATPPVSPAGRLAAMPQTPEGRIAGVDPTRGGMAAALARRLAFHPDARRSR